MLFPIRIGARHRGDLDPGRISPKEIAARLRELTTFSTRHTLSSQHVKAAKWLHSQFQSLGYDDVQFHSYELRGLTRCNVVCMKPGQAKLDPLIIVCAHFDSRSKDLENAESPAPGADDNASGIAALLELARVLKNVRTQASVQFVAFSGEEQGLAGSSAYARHLKEKGQAIDLVLNMDMIGHPIDRAGLSIVVEYDVGNRRPENDAPSRAAAVQMLRAARRTELRAKLGPIDASDYMPFESEGVVCIGVFDGADHEPFYHTAHDCLEQVDVDYCAEVVKLVLMTVIERASRAG
jgi:Zn-dependent M28 family amino/carboxypeptidase